MAKAKAELIAFNRGVVTPLALARIDVKRIGMSAEEQTNWVPRVVGAMSLRPGLRYLGSTSGNAAAKQIPFIFATSDTALIELTSNIMRVRVDDVLVPRVAVSTAVANGTFDTNLGGWAVADAGTAASTWLAGGYMKLLGDGTNAAKRTQTLTVASGDQSVQHALRVEVTQGPCTLRVGKTSGGDEYISETVLQPGTHSLTFTPTAASVYLQLLSTEAYPVLVSQVSIEAAGVLAIPTLWAADDLQNIRFDQSGDAIFVACYGVKQQRIERRANSSWSVVDYVVNDGPFRVQNLTPVTLTASALTGSITLTASRAVFKKTHVGALFQLESLGQNVSSTLTAVGNTGSIEVSTSILTSVTSTAAFSYGVVTQVRARSFGIVITGLTGTTSTVTLQRSVGVVGVWEDVALYTINQSTSYDDGLTNSDIFYRLAIKIGNYVAGTIVCTLNYAAGSINGVARVTAYTSATIVTASVLKALGATAATDNWSEGAWSDYRGYPSSVAFHDGRLGWFGGNKIEVSVSDTFDSLDADTLGDSGPILRSIGSGPVDKIRWAVSGDALILGAEGSEWTIRSSVLDEPLTPTNTNLKAYTSIGASQADAGKLDSEILFVDRSGSRLQSLSPGASGKYVATEMSTLAPEMCEPSVTRLTVQRHPETRVHLVRSDGKVAMLVYDKNEDVKAWITIETDGLIEDVAVLPGGTEDNVYYVVNRTINGATVRYVEKWALMSEAIGGSINKQADSFIEYSGVSTTTITGLNHLEGETVVCHSAGADLGTFTVSSGSITLTSAVTSAIVGLTYRARFKSVKLAYATQEGSTLTEVTRLDHIGLILANTHAQGIRYGPDFDNMDELPLVEDGAEVAGNYVWGHYDQGPVEFNGVYDTDSRICLEANAPRACTVLGVVVG